MWWRIESPHAIDVVPGFRHDAGRLHQHRVDAECGIDLHGELRRDAPALGAETVQPLDAVFGVKAVAAHVPLTGRASRAGDWVRRAHDTHDVIAFGEPIRGLDHAAERLMSEDQAVASAWRLAVVPIDDLAVGAADPKRYRIDQQRAFGS